MLYCTAYCSKPETSFMNMCALLDKTIYGRIFYLFLCDKNTFVMNAKQICTFYHILYSICHLLPIYTVLKVKIKITISTRELPLKCSQADAALTQLV